jgi:hypothetical protein
MKIIWQKRYLITDAEKKNIYMQRFKPLQIRNGLSPAKWLGLKFSRGTTRDYLFILQPYHFEHGVMDRMLKSNWNRHFSKLNIEKNRHIKYRKNRHRMLSKGTDTK